MIVALITIAVILILYGAVSKPLDARGITSAMIFTTAGLAVGTSALKLVNIHLESITAERFCELALVFLLFSDSTRIDLAGLRRNLGWPSRLLLIGLPLTMLAGLGAGLLVFPGIALASAFVLSTMLCSTDAALGQRVVSDKSVPARVRQALDVESGLNDGLAVPFFLVAVDLSLAQLSGGVTAAVVRNMAEQIGWGLVAGIGAGTLAGLLLRVADDRGWLEGQWRQILPLVAALLAYLAALRLGGSGFIAASVSSVPASRVRTRSCRRRTPSGSMASIRGATPEASMICSATASEIISARCLRAAAPPRPARPARARRRPGRRAAGSSCSRPHHPLQLRYRWDHRVPLRRMIVRWLILAVVPYAVRPALCLPMTVPAVILLVLTHSANNHVISFVDAEGKPFGLALSGPSHPLSGGMFAAAVAVTCEVAVVVWVLGRRADMWLIRRRQPAITAYLADPTQGGSRDRRPHPVRRGLSADGAELWFHRESQVGPVCAGRGFSPRGIRLAGDAGSPDRV